MSNQAQQNNNQGQNRNNQGQNRNNNHGQNLTNYNNTSNRLLDKTVDVDPVAVVYNITGDDIKEFVTNYATAYNINGVASSVVNVVRTGNERPEISIYLVLDSSSSDLSSNMHNVPVHLRKKMDVGGFKPTENLKRSMIPLTREIKMVSRDRYVFIKCDVFKVLALMLKVNPKAHTLNVTEVASMKGNAILTVIKGTKFVGESKSDNKFERLVRSIED